MPLKLSNESFSRIEIIWTVFDQAEAKFAGAREPAFQLTARTAHVPVEEVREIIANRDARWEV